MKNLPQKFWFDENRLEQSALAQIRACLASGQKLAAALSGGSDSVFLLHMAVQICGAENIVALHYNHKVRKNADADEEFCKKLCAGLGVRLVAKSRKKSLKKISEESLRLIRKKFFEDECKRLKIGAILQGHIKNDVAETMLMRLMRGASADGLCAPRPVSKTNSLAKIRPLLALSKAQIQAELKKFGIGWREDESNRENKFLRNKIRNEILPAIEKASDFSFVNSAARARMLIEEDCALIAEIFEKSAQWRGGKIFLSPEAARSPALLRRAIQALLAQKNLKLRAAAVDDFIKACLKNKNAQTSLKENFLTFSAKELSLEISPPAAFPHKKIPLKLGENKLPGGAALVLEEVSVSKGLLEKIRAGFFKESECAFVAPRQKEFFAREILPSDAYAPIGAKSARLVKDMMSAKKTPVLKRKSFPLVCLSSGEAVWAPTLAPADFCKLSKIGRAFRLTYRASF
ncbi:MAG: tRNA lysidine(34) synthetase TilS [Opitutales bacterium]|nr:tRNA lysidine(34) synthetase TilS [Opitutales bacterium]